ncbi:hypothetical protein BCE02nite_49710 [Brevibacillus centrosporus]|nr:hypothetical protein BCE02nite_49710 [Brevibacillus centrosporus]
MYTEIHQLKELGLSKTQVANRLGFNVNTVSKYWNVSPEGMVDMRNRVKQTKYSAYEETILG